ncbi:MAG: sigma-70 family RNA polymerase sigma factor, partial [Defluviitaleaceae bacterium]|nr:sigma-70 family RNA polymerase sigma factor [Defluviitaleaceae bacterium]
LNNPADAEDMAGDIFVELLRSCENMRDSSHFYGFMWGVARNVYKRRLRDAKQKHLPAYDISDYEGILADAPLGTSSTEHRTIAKEELFTLKQELSLLSKEYREATVLYYLKNKSCTEIAEAMGLTHEMVKYYLFRARKLLKEGMSMPRAFGEKSYDPEIFKIDYWGDGTKAVYQDLFERRLPGNLLLAAYYEPLTMTELSLELGVATPYLEDEVGIMLEHELLKSVGKGKYQTNIVIFTTEYEAEVYNATKSLYAPAADVLFSFISTHEDAIRKLDFHGADFTKNRFYWAMVIVALLRGYNMSGEPTEFPALADGSKGYVYGYSRSYDNHKFRGIAGSGERDIAVPAINIVNYKILNNGINVADYQMHYKAIMNLISQPESVDEATASELVRCGLAICTHDHAQANFPVFTKSQYDALLDILHPIASTLAETINKANREATKILRAHVPKGVKDKCDALARLTCGMNAMAHIVEYLCEQHKLIVPPNNEPVFAWGVIQ